MNTRKEKFPICCTHRRKRKIDSFEYAKEKRTRPNKTYVRLNVMCWHWLCLLPLTSLSMLNSWVWESKVFTFRFISIFFQFSFPLVLSKFQLLYLYFQKILVCHCQSTQTTKIYKMYDERRTTLLGKLIFSVVVKTINNFHMNFQHHENAFQTLDMKIEDFHKFSFSSFSLYTTCQPNTQRKPKRMTFSIWQLMANSQL